MCERARAFVGRADRFGSRNVCAPCINYNYTRDELYFIFLFFFSDRHCYHSRRYVQLSRRAFFFFFLVQRNDNNYYLRAAACVETRCKVIVENHGRRRVREAATARAPVKSLSRPAYARGLVCITHDTRSCERRDVTRKKKNNNNK